MWEPQELRIPWSHTPLIAIVSATLNIPTYLRDDIGKYLGLLMYIYICTHFCKYVLACICYRAPRWHVSIRILLQYAMASSPDYRAMAEGGICWILSVCLRPSGLPYESREEQYEESKTSKSMSGYKVGLG